jgi:hypothetical protein
MNTEELIKYFAVTKPHEGEFRQDSFISPTLLAQQFDERSTVDNTNKISLNITNTQIIFYHPFLYLLTSTPLAISIGNHTGRSAIND